jgi:hypothetical protein
MRGLGESIANPAIDSLQFHVCFGGLFDEESLVLCCYGNFFIFDFVRKFFLEHSEPKPRQPSAGGNIFQRE